MLTGNCTNGETMLIDKNVKKKNSLEEKGERRKKLRTAGVER